MPMASAAQALPPGNSLCRTLWAVGRGQRAGEGCSDRGDLQTEACPSTAEGTLHSAHFSWGLGCLCPSKHWAIIWSHDLARASTETTPSVLSATLRGGYREYYYY